MSKTTRKDKETIQRIPVGVTVPLTRLANVPRRVMKEWVRNGTLEVTGTTAKRIK